MRYVASSGEEVSEEAWRWVATYEDGSSLRQFDPDTGRFHNFREIDQERLAFFRLVSDANRQGVGFAFLPGAMKLVHFYRTTRLNVGTDAETLVRQYVFGYELSVAGTRSGLFITLNPDGSAFIGGEDRPDLWTPVAESDGL